MAARLTKRERVVIARSVHPHYRDVLATYAANLGLAIVEVGYGPDGRLDLEALAREANGGAAIIFQYPNFFGIIEDPRPIVEIAKKVGALSVATVTEPLALAMLQPPGAFGVDVVAAELQSFGIPPSFGGPHCGAIAASEKCLRQMPGRLVGVAKDTEGRTGYVLTLSTREQHIRREKATSNICTNSGLMTLCASMFMAAYGKRGLPKLARLNFDKAQHALEQITAIPGDRLQRRFAAPFFNEFVVAGVGKAAEVHQRLIGQGIVAGIPLGSFYPELDDALLLCVTDVNAAPEIDRLVRALADVTRSAGAGA
jgi:glycine dehydrogenase subunit 1